jgi:sugar phosphate isomerase/epimerase
MNREIAVRVLLNTIAVEPNRWAKDQPPAHDLGRDILPRAREAGFRRLEVWPHHAACKTAAELRALRASAAEQEVDFPVLGAYPVFHLEGAAAEAERRRQFELLEKAQALGARWLKFFLGRLKGGEISPAQLETTRARLAEWTARGRGLGLGFCAEIHGGTLLDPFDSGLRFLDAHPELEIRFCFQPCGDSAQEELEQRIAALGRRIVHAHLSGGNERGRCRLKDAGLDWARLLRALRAANPEFLPSLEFVPGGFPAPGRPFDWGAALGDAVADARFVEEALGGG